MVLLHNSNVEYWYDWSNWWLAFHEITSSGTLNRRLADDYYQSWLRCQLSSYFACGLSSLSIASTVLHLFSLIYFHHQSAKVDRYWHPFLSQFRWDREGTLLRISTLTSVVRVVVYWLLHQDLGEFMFNGDSLFKSGLLLGQMMICRHINSLVVLL